MKKVVLVSLDSKYIHTNLSLLYLKSFTENMKDKINVEIIELTINDRLEYMLEKIMSLKPDYLGFSTYIWNIEQVEKIENLICLVNSDIEIFYGGPEVSYGSKEFLENHRGKYIISGEGEKTFSLFLQYILGEVEFKQIKGLYYKDACNNILFNGEAELIDLNELVFPYYNYEFDTRIVYYEASRGCPFNCSYCLSSVIRGLRQLDMNRVKNEIDFFVNKNLKLVKFVDRTFNANMKFAKEIWKYIINIDSETTFHFEIAGDILDDESIKILSEAKKGQIQLEVGVQTTNENVIMNINRKTNIDKLRKNILKLKEKNNINIHLDLIAGLPEEDLESFKQSFNDVYNMKSNELQLGFLKVIKGSPIALEKKKWGIINSPYSPYEVLYTKDISYEQLLQLKQVEAMVDKYHNSKRFVNSVNFFIKKFISPYDFFYNLSKFYETKGYFDKKINGGEYSNVLLQFNNDVLDGTEDDFLVDIIKYDYLKYNKKRWLPEFMKRHLSLEEEKKLKNEFIDKGVLDKNHKNHIELYEYDILNFEKSNVVQLRKNIIIYNIDGSESQIFF